MKKVFQATSPNYMENFNASSIPYKGVIGDYVSIKTCSNYTGINGNALCNTTRSLENMLNIPHSDRVTNSFHLHVYNRPLPFGDENLPIADFCYKYMKSLFSALIRMRESSHIMYDIALDSMNRYFDIDNPRLSNVSIDLNILKSVILNKGAGVLDYLKQDLTDSVISNYDRVNDKYDGSPIYLQCSSYVFPTRSLLEFVNQTRHTSVIANIRSRRGTYVGSSGMVYYFELGSRIPEMLYAIMIHKDYKVYYNLCSRLGVTPDPTIFKVFVRAGFDVVRSPHASMRKVYRSEVLKYCKEFNIPIETVDNFKALFGSEGKFVFKSISERKKYEEDLSFDLLNTARTRIKLPKMERPTEQRVEVITKEIKSENLVAIDGVTIDLSQFM